AYAAESFTMFGNSSNPSRTTSPNTTASPNPELESLLEAGEPSRCQRALAVQDRMGPVTTSAVAERTALSGKEWRVLVLLVIPALINYIDRTTLSVGATDIQRELGLTNTQ